MGKINLIKFGRSEIKRTNIKQSYTYLIDLINKNSGKLLSREDIVKQLKDEKFYKDEKKESNPNREISFINSSYFGQLELEGKKLKVTSNEISKNWDNEKYDLSFFGLTSIDFAFFQFLLKSTYKSNEKIKSSFFHLIKFLIEYKKIEKNMIISEELEKELKDDIFSKNINKLINKCTFKSGSSNQEVSSLSNELVNEFLNLWHKDEENPNYENIHIIINKIMDGKSIKFSSGISELIFGEKNKINSFAKYIKGMANNPEKINGFICDGINDIYNRVLSRIIAGSWGDYRYLIKSHLNALDNIFIINGNDEFFIAEKYQELINTIINKGESTILKLEKNKFYSPSELLDFFGLKNQVIQTEKAVIIKKFYTIDKLKDLFKSIDKFIISKNNNHTYNTSGIYKIIQNHEHIKGKVDFPTFYEFISGMAFLSKQFEEKPNSFENENEIILKTFRGKLDTSLCPVRFAAGGRADVQIFSSEKRQFINIEPTTQLIDQTRMELCSVRNHLEKDWKVNNDKKLKLAKAIIVTTKNDKNIIDDLKGWNKKEGPKLEIKVYDIGLILKMLESEESIFDFINKNS